MCFPSASVASPSAQPCSPCSSGPPVSLLRMTPASLMQSCNCTQPGLPGCNEERGKPNKDIPVRSRDRKHPLPTFSGQRDGFSFRGSGALTVHPQPHCDRLSSVTWAALQANLGENREIEIERENLGDFLRHVLLYRRPFLNPLADG